MKISFCIITLNEELNLSRCLRSCADLADEIIILDSGSTDGTERVAKEFGARFERQKWLGYVGQKQAALSLASHEWVFNLDADEELSPTLRAEISQLRDGAPRAMTSGYSMPRCVLYEGRWIRHGDWYPDRLVRLFQRNHGRFVGHEPHCFVALDAPQRVTRLAGDIFHHSFKDASDHWARCQKYAQLWAETQHELGRRAGPLAPLTHSAFRWFRGYVLKRGFLDGAHGWRIAGFCAREVALKYRLLRELNDRRT